MIGEVLCYIGESLAAVETHLAGQPPVKHVTAAAAATLPQAKDSPALAKSVAGFNLSLTPTPPARGSRYSHKAQELIRSRGLNESDFASRGLIREQDVLLHLGEAIPRSTRRNPPPRRRK